MEEVQVVKTSSTTKTELIPREQLAAISKSFGDIMQNIDLVSEFGVQVRNQTTKKAYEPTIITKVVEITQGIQALIEVTTEIESEITNFVFKPLL